MCKYRRAHTCINTGEHTHVQIQESTHMYKYRRVQTCIKSHALSYHRACLQSQQITADTAGSHQQRGRLFSQKLPQIYTRNILLNSNRKFIIVGIFKSHYFQYICEINPMLLVIHLILLFYKILLCLNTHKYMHKPVYSYTQTLVHKHLDWLEFEFVLILL